MNDQGEGQVIRNEDEMTKPSRSSQYQRYPSERSPGDQSRLRRKGNEEEMIQDFNFLIKTSREIRDT